MNTLFYNISRPLLQTESSTEKQAVLNTSELEQVIARDNNVIFLLHGLFGDHKNLQGLASTLKEKHTVIAIDLCNHGQSYRSNTMNYPQLALDIKELIDHLSLTSVTLIGHSLGGKVAMACALSYPERIKNLIVLDIAPVNYNQPQQTEHRHSAIFRVLEEISHSDIQTRQEALTRLNQKIDQPAIASFLAKSFTLDTDDHWQFNLNSLSNNYSLLMDWPFVLKESSYQGPTLFIKGALSDYMLSEHTDAILTQFPRAKTHIVLHADHWLHVEQKESVLRAIQKFLY